VSDQSATDKLRNLSALTDSSLGRLDLQDLLTELLQRVRTIVEADTAAVLLREDGSDELVARAACGLEEEVRFGLRVPVGAGFAGLIADRKEPVFLDRVDATTVANPLLWEKGIRTMLGVPLLSSGIVIGVIHVGRLDARAFTAEDVELLQVAAERVTGATLANTLALESAAARLLERSLQPTRLPNLAGLEMAGLYAPADNRTIGGDWYDAFTVPSGQLWLVAGDVAGHGLNAAVVMGRVKSALRSYALRTSSPSDALELTDHKVQHFEIGTMVTVICATSMPPYEKFELCSAGHLPPVLTAPNSEPQLVDLPVNPPLGVRPGIERETATVALAPGGALLLYTDGLVERRDQPIDEGLERLRTAVPDETPGVICRTVTQRLLGDVPTADDIAMLAIRRSC
jgi:hypothetical protein